MFSLLCELHFWTQSEGIVVDSSDFGAFTLQVGKERGGSAVRESKRLYSERRGVALPPGRGKRSRKLRDSLSELEEALAGGRLVRLSWKCPTVVRAVFENGLQSYVRISGRSGVPEEVVFDKFLMGKLPSAHVADVAASSTEAVFAFTNNRVTRAVATRPTFGGLSTKKLSSLEVKLSHIELAAGPSGRRLDKRLSLNLAGDVLLMWWKCGRDEVYPWSPQVRSEDRANVHVYSLSDSSALELICYYRTKYDPVDVLFSRVHLATVHTIQQRIDDEGLVTLEWENARLEGPSIHSNYSLSLRLPTHVAALALSPKEDKLVATCIDGSILVADSYGNVTSQHRTDLIPSLATWHPEGALVVVGDNKGHLQWYDGALTPSTCQVLNHEGSSTTVDVGSYFKYQPNLVGLHWNRSQGELTADVADDCGDFLLLEFEKGPLVVLKLIGRGLTVDTLVVQYLRCEAYGPALNLLHSLDWEVDSTLALSTLQFAVSFLMRRPLCLNTEAAIEAALGSFLSPLRPIPEEVAAELSDSVLDLAKRYFHLLVRYRCFDKAFRLAIDLGRDDLFMDLHYGCKEAGNHVMATAARERAEEICCSSASSSGSTDGSRSQSSSGPSSEQSDDASSTSSSELETKILPPLPIESPLETARNKVCHSSILQQHNYRRHPAKPADQNGAAVMAATLLRPNCRLPSRAPLNGSHFADYTFDDENDACFIHHPNTPSSRAPLQFNTPVDGRLTDVVCAQLATAAISDQTVAFPYSLKVANARRRPINHPPPTDDSLARSTLMRSCLRPPLWPTEPPVGVPTTPVMLNNLGVSSESRATPKNIWGPADPNQVAPNNLGVSGGDSRVLLNNFGERSVVSNSGTWGPTSLRAMPTNVEHPSAVANDLRVPVDTPSLTHSWVRPDRSPNNKSWDGSVTAHSLPPVPTDALQFKSSFARNCQSFSAGSDPQPREPPIVASAETEDGKIKVVHFGLV